MQRNHRERSSDYKNLIGAPEIRSQKLREFMQELANVRDEKLDWFRKKHRRLLLDRYHSNACALYRDELRLLWHPTQGIPEQEWRGFEDWRKTRPTAEPGEMICNRWLQRSEVGLLAIWEKRRRELIPSAADLPAMLVYGCLLWSDRLFYCQNSNCGAPWFIGTRRGQQYCSNECAWPAKKAAKRKWWRANRARTTKSLLSNTEVKA
jgi:hypothetical protein